MPLGRPRAPGTDEERAEVRRAKVRRNVQAFRQRQREKELQQGSASGSRAGSDSGRSSTTGARGPYSSASTSEVESTRFAVRLASSDDGDAGDGTWGLQMPMKIDVGPAFQDAFISALEYRHLPERNTPFLPESDPNMGVSVCCSSWVQAACLKVGSPGSELLSDALLAAALNVIGRERNDPDLALRGVQVHTRALNRMRQAFEKLISGEEGLSPALLSVAALTCAISELLVNHSWDNFAKHLQGVGALIELGGPSALNSLSTRKHFYGFRAVQAAFCFSHRQESFITKSEWIDFPWRDEHPIANNPLHTMLDIALHIPPEIREHQRTTQRSPGELRNRVDRLQRIALQLDQWNLDLDVSYETPIYRMRPARWRGLHDESIEFANLAVASAFTFYTGVRIQLFDLLRNVADELGMVDYSVQAVSQAAGDEMLKWSRIACQCFDFFHATDKKVVGRLICVFPLDTAWEIFARLHQEGKIDLSRELAWCHSTAERFTAMGLPVLQWR